MHTFRRLLSALALSASALLGLVPAEAATVRRSSIDGVPVILVAGTLAYGDEKQFAFVSRDMPKALVALDGPGGNLHAGLEIGRAIRMKGYVTLAPKSCASACALAWLGGQKRAMFPGARVGFHAAYTDESGTLVPTSSGNALVGAYLNQLGLSSNAIIYVTSTSPESMAWLTTREARYRGIEVVDLQDARSASPDASLPRSPDTNDWTSYGEWVQVASRQSLGEATAFAEQSRLRNANTNVFRYSNGWYVVVIGPFSSGRGEVARSALVNAGEAPGDSLVTQGERFVALEWGPRPARKPNTSAAFVR